MSFTVWVKVVGFSDVERHSLNTIFRLSGRDGPNYQLWSPDIAAPAQVALIDVDSYEAGLELVSPSFNPNLKMICVGAQAPTLAWRTVQRPVDWAAMVQMLDELFVSATDVDIDISLEEAPHVPLPPGVKRALLAGLPSVEARLYLRTRLALAGITSVDEAQTQQQLDSSIQSHPYNVVLVHVNTQELDPWVMVKHLQDTPQASRSVIAVAPNSTWKFSNLAERMGCIGLLEMPFNPQQVYTLLQKV
jgi:CheY-like chemotaxis protein